MTQRDRRAGKNPSRENNTPPPQIKRTLCSPKRKQCPEKSRECKAPHQQRSQEAEDIHNLAGRKDQRVCIWESRENNLSHLHDSETAFAEWTEGEEDGGDERCWWEVVHCEAVVVEYECEDCKGDADAPEDVADYQCPEAMCGV